MNALPAPIRPSEHLPLPAWWPAVIVVIIVLALTAPQIAAAGVPVILAEALRRRLPSQAGCHAGA